MIEKLIVDHDRKYETEVGRQLAQNWIHTSDKINEIIDHLNALDNKVFPLRDTSHLPYEECGKVLSTSIVGDMTCMNPKPYWVHDCNCASFFTVRGVHKTDCPAYVPKSPLLSDPEVQKLSTG